jgi:hypothetical protein
MIQPLRIWQNKWESRLPDRHATLVAPFTHTHTHSLSQPRMRLRQHKNNCDVFVLLHLSTSRAYRDVSGGECLQRQSYLHP